MFLSMLAVMSGSQTATAALYTEDFNTGLGGWSVLPDSLGSGSAVWRSTGGVANTGFIEGSRGPDRFNASPNFFAESGTALANSIGNLNALYGNLIEISYFGKVISGVVTPQGPNHLFWKNGFTTAWQKETAPSLAPFLADWTQVSFQIDTNWTDAQAMANGWGRIAGSESWADTLLDINPMFPFYALTAGANNPSPEVVVGLDNFRMASAAAVPEPSTLTLWSLGAITLVGIGWRRRKRRSG